ncbi:hypothetical protein RRG08_046690 [Elysia crispata]|uniref:Uncharacterized protein n=1 Tax=Elysia crispata TaxID=231223 RepID=A0AAE1DVK8_9GAST|nr:hypothetical protein RRG08_046690 [Elysia crispata]
MKICWVKRKTKKLSSSFQCSSLKLGQTARRPRFRFVVDSTVPAHWTTPDHVIIQDGIYPASKWNSS